LNKLNEMNIADLTEQEVEQLRNYEKDLNKLHQGEEIYLLALKR